MGKASGAATTKMTTRTVGTAAAEAGLSAKAIRIYEAKGLLRTAPRTAAGYRTYTDDDVAVLRFIRQAKTLGLSLAEIGDILAIRRGGTPPCRHVVRLLDQHIRGLDHTINELRQLRRSLAQTRMAAAEHRIDETSVVCGIVEHSVVVPAPEMTPRRPAPNPPPRGRRDRQATAERAFVSDN